MFFFICRTEGETERKRISVKQLAKEANPFQAFLDSRTFMSVSFALLFAVNVLINFGNTAFDQAFNYYLKDVLGLTSSYNGIIKAAVGLISFVSNMTLCIWIIKRTDTKRSMVCLTSVCAVAALGTVVSPGMGMLMGFGVLVYAD